MSFSREEYNPISKSRGVGYSLTGEIGESFSARAFGSTPSEPNWYPVADINSDGIVDIFDIVVVALHFGETG